MANYLICYDIANPRRLGKVHRRTVAHALFVQYSVYYLQGSREDLEQLLHEIADVMNPGEDDVRAYQTGDIQLAFRLGRHWLPDDIILH